MPPSLVVRNPPSAIYTLKPRPPHHPSLSLPLPAPLLSRLLLVTALHPAPNLLALDDDDDDDDDGGGSAASAAAT
jgi:hypothetical protein